MTNTSETTSHSSNLQKWLQLASATEPLQECLLNILHGRPPYDKVTQNSLPDDPSELYKVLDRNKKVRNKLRPQQLKSVLPEDEKTDSSKLDITCLKILIQRFTGLKTKNGQWDESLLDPNDTSLASYVVRAVAFRNEVFHYGRVTNLTEEKFENLWKRVQTITHGLNYYGDIEKYKRLSFDASGISSFNTFKQCFEKAFDTLENIFYRLKDELDEQKKILAEFPRRQEQQPQLMSIQTQIDDEMKAFDITKNNIHLLLKECSPLTCTQEEHLQTIQIQLQHEFASCSNVIQTYKDRVHAIKQTYRVEHTSHLDVDIRHLEPLPQDTYAKDSILQIVEENIGEDRHKLSREIYCENPKFTWCELKHELKAIDRNDIVKEISERGMNTDVICSFEHNTPCFSYNIYSVRAVEVHQVVQKTDMKGDNLLEFFRGGNKMRSISYEQWDKECEEFFQKYFEQQTKTQFPTKWINEKLLARVGQSLLKCIDADGGSVHVFTEYDLVSHVKFYLNNNEKEYHRILGKLFIKNANDLVDPSRRMLLFHTKVNLVLIFRLSPGKSEKEIAKEGESLCSDLKLLMLTNKRFLVKSHVTFKNVIVAPEMSTIKKNSSDTSCVIMDQTVINGGNDSIRSWWRATMPQEAENQTKGDSLRSIVISIFGHYGTRKIDRKQFGHFPVLPSNLPKDTHWAILNLMFTVPQASALNCPSLKKIVFGGYGCGKSLIGQYQLEELVKREAYSSNYVFYICWDHRSLCHLQMQNFLDDINIPRHNPNINVYNIKNLAENFLKLPKRPSFSELLDAVKKRCKEAIAHIIIDEFDMECLNGLECQKIKSMFKTEEWKQSVVLLLPQPLEKRRVIIHENEPPKKDDDKAYQSIGMTLFTLEDHMRSTRYNFEFTEEVGRIITKDLKNIISRETDRHRKTEFPEDPQKIVNIPKENRVAINSNKSTDIKTTLNRLSFLNEKPNPGVKFQESIDLDDFTDNVVSPNRTETTYMYRQSERLGHGIVGHRPIFIYFREEPKSINECTTELVLVLKSLCLEESCCKLLIANYGEALQIAVQIMRSLGEQCLIYHSLLQYKLQDNCNREMNCLPKKYNLITDHRGAKGLEFPCVITFMENESLTRQQSFLDQVSRCTSKLFLIYPHAIDDENVRIPPVLYKTLRTSPQRLRNYVIHRCNADTDDAIVENGSQDYNKFTVNINSSEYKQIYTRTCPFLTQLRSNHTTKISPLSPPKDVTATYKKSSNCTITWQDAPYHFIVKRKQRNAEEWEFVSAPFSTSTFIITELENGKEYTFGVVKVTTLGESQPTEISWMHVDLFYVIRGNNLESLKRCLDISPWRRHDKKALFPLYHQAIICDKPDILQALRDSIADKDINSVDQWKQTPLHLASKLGRTQCVEWLLTNNADYGTTDMFGKTAYDWAKSDDVRELFLKYTS